MTRDEYLSRAHEFAPRGERLPHARLNAETVRAIRTNRRGLTARQWAEKLGVHQRTIDKVRDYRSWRHVA
jgi:predicted DNA-binding protein (UPF0251 family)